MVVPITGLAERMCSSSKTCPPGFTTRAQLAQSQDRVWDRAKDECPHRRIEAGIRVIQGLHVPKLEINGNTQCLGAFPGFFEHPGRQVDGRDRPPCRVIGKILPRSNPNFQDLAAAAPVTTGASATVHSGLLLCPPSGRTWVTGAGNENGFVLLQRGRANSCFRNLPSCAGPS